MSFSNDLAYDLVPQIGSAARLGLIALSTDETVEDELHMARPAGDIAIFTARIASAAEVTRANLADMQARIAGTAQLLPPSVDFDAVAYACTSASSVIGSDRVAALVQEGCRTRAVTNPARALIHACATAGAHRLALISPYTEEVNASLRGTLREAGIATPEFASFNEPLEANVARIDPASIAQAARQIAGQSDVDAVFLSCTNLRTQTIIGPLSEELGKPVWSSNSVLFDHLFELGGVGAR